MSDSSKSTKENSENGGNQTSEKKESWGYDLYPERRGTFKPSVSNILLGREGKEGIEKMKCEKNVYKCIKESMYFLILNQIVLLLVIKYIM